jgi:hypothetical protein
VLSENEKTDFKEAIGTALKNAETDAEGGIGKYIQ